MADGTGRSGEHNGMATTRERSSSVGMTFSDSPKARAFCLTERPRTRLIGHCSGHTLSALRVFGKECCFSPQSGSSVKGELVLRVLSEYPSDNSHALPPPSQDLNLQLLADIPVIPTTALPENPQHSFALFGSPHSLLLATLICTFKCPFLPNEISSYPPLPEGCFLE